jgi:5-hydroxyisourate hydrolase
MQLLLALLSVASAQDFLEVSDARIRDEAAALHYLVGGNTANSEPVGMDAHVLDTTKGTGAEGISIDLEFGMLLGQWVHVSSMTTEPTGRTGLFTTTLRQGYYRLTVKTGDYWAKQGIETFYPMVQVIIKLTDKDMAKGAHIPFTISPWGYSTYKGV